MKKFFTLTLILGLVVGLTGCFGEETDEKRTEENDVIQEENNQDERARTIEESGLEIGTGTGMRDDPYIIDVDEMQVGNVTDYVVGVPSLYYAVPAAPGKTYTGTLIITSTSVEQTPFWASVVANAGMYTDSDAEKLEGLELVGQDMVVSVEISEMASSVNFNITTNVLGQDVFYEFYVEEE